MTLYRKTIALLSILLPWWLRRRVLIVLLGYELDPTSFIGFSFVAPRRLSMFAHARIGHLNVCKSIELLEIREYATIGQLNWISGYPLDKNAHYSGDDNRYPKLELRRHSAITQRHLLDCSDSITVGEYSIVAGYRSQILTHSVDLVNCRQLAAPVSIGAYCFVGTGSVLLSGCCLPDYTVLGAHSLLNKCYHDSYSLYAGSPAKLCKKLSVGLGYFSRATGNVE